MTGRNVKLDKLRSREALRDIPQSSLPLYFRIFEVIVQLHMRGTCNVFALIFGITNLKVYIGQSEV